MHQKVLEIVSKFSNREVIARLREVGTDMATYAIYPKNNPDTMVYISYLRYEISKLIFESENEILDISKPYYAIEVSAGRNRLNFYTNKIEEVENIISKENEYLDSYIEDKGIYYEHGQ